MVWSHKNTAYTRLVIHYGLVARLCSSWLSSAGGESDPNFPWEYSQLDNKVITKNHFFISSPEREERGGGGGGVYAVLPGITRACLSSRHTAMCEECTGPGGEANKPTIPIVKLMEPTFGRDYMFQLMVMLW